MLQYLLFFGETLCSFFKSSARGSHNTVTKKNKKQLATCEGYLNCPLPTTLKTLFLGRKALLTALHPKGKEKTV